MIEANRAGLDEADEMGSEFFRISRALRRLGERRAQGEPRGESVSPPAAGCGRDIRLGARDERLLAAPSGAGGAGSASP